MAWADNMQHIRNRWEGKTVATIEVASAMDVVIRFTDGTGLRVVSSSRKTQACEHCHVRHEERALLFTDPHGEPNPPLVLD